MMMSRYSARVEKSCVVIGKGPKKVLYDSRQWLLICLAAVANFQSSLWLATLVQPCWLVRNSLLFWEESP